MLFRSALASAPVFHVDFTFGRCNGSTTTVAIVCDEDNNVVYQAKEKKGKEGVKLEFPGILLTVASNDPRKFKGRWKSQIVPIHPYIFLLIFSTTFISINSSI